MNLLQKLFATCAGLLVVAGTASAATYELDMDDQILTGQESVVALKREIRKQYGVRIDHERLVAVTVFAKSRRGQGGVSLSVDDIRSEEYNVPGHPEDWQNPAPYTFTRLDLYPSTFETEGAWQLHFRGNIMLRTVTVTTQPQAHRPPPPVPQPPVQDLIQIHRFYTGFSHFWTIDLNEGYYHRLQYDGVGFRTFARHMHGLTPIYRCWNGTTHFISVDQFCEGYRQEGNLGFVSVHRTHVTSRDLYRCWNGRAHLITTDANECLRNGYRIEHVLGYVN